MKFMRLICVPLFFAAAVAFVVSASGTQANATERPGRIAFLMGPDVYSMKPDGSDVKQLTNLGSQNIGASWESWSFDGTQIVFVEYPPNSGPPQLWLMNADGSNQHRVFDDGKFQDAAPSFAPDGSHIVFTRCQPTWPADDTSCAIYRVNTNGSGLTAITKFGLNVNDWEPVYSPDGCTIALDAFGWQGFASAIWLMDADGTHMRRLTPGALGAFNPAWSADGKQVAFATNLHGDVFFFNEEIGVINSNRTGLRFLTHNNKDWDGYLTAPHDISPSWSPDGTEIVFERDSPRFTSSGIYVVTADGDGLSLRFESPNPVQFVPDLTGNFRQAGSSNAKDLLKRIESGGFRPRWGRAQ
jgi:Tol biopolymer transport system component